MSVGSEKVTLSLNIPPDKLQDAFQGEKSMVNLSGTVGKGSDKKSVSVMLDPSTSVYSGKYKGKDVGFDIKFDAKKDTGSTGAQFKLTDVLPASKLTPDSLKLGATHDFKKGNTDLSLGVSKDFKFGDGKLTTSVTGKAGTGLDSEKAGFVSVTYKPKSKPKKDKLVKTIDQYGAPMVKKYADTKSGGLKKTKKGDETQLKSDIDATKKKVKDVVSEVCLTEAQLKNLILLLIVESL